MLHVEHRHVLMNHDFEVIHRASLSKAQKLVPVHVVRGGHAMRAALPQIVNCQFIGWIQGKIGDEG